MFAASSISGLWAHFVNLGFRRWKVCLLLFRFGNSSELCLWLVGCFWVMKLQVAGI